MKRLMIFSLLVLSCLSLAAEQLTDSVRVHFRVNKIEIDTLLMGNDAAMRGFAQRMSDLAELSGRPDVKVKITKVLITGAASPEGSVPYNKMLSEKRAQAITRWLGTYFEIPDSITKFVFKGRDWQGALEMVEADPNVPYRQEVIVLIKDIQTRKSGIKTDGMTRLKALRSGIPYRYILRRHFPQLRASEVFITATVEPVAVDNDLNDLKDSNDLKDLIIEANDSIPPDSLMTPTIEIQLLPKNGYVFAIKTNLIHDALLIPDIGVEFPIGSHLSVGANWMYTWFKNHDRNRHWRIYGGDINARYYFGGRTDRASLQGHHVGVYGQVLLFQTANGDKGYISGIPGEDIWGKPWLGGGVEYGYSLRLARRLNLDFSIGVGYIGGEYRVYNPIDNCYVWNSTHRQRWFGPTKAEISLEWLIGKMPRHAALHTGTPEGKEVAE